MALLSHRRELPTGQFWLSSAFIRPSRARGGDSLNRKARPGRAGGRRGSPPQTFAKQLLLLRISCRKVRIVRRVQLVSVHDHRHWARRPRRWRSQLTFQAVLFHSPLPLHHGSPLLSPSGASQPCPGEGLGRASSARAEQLLASASGRGPDRPLLLSDHGLRVA